MSSNNEPIWNYSKNNETHGPASLNSIVDLYRLGQLDDTTRVWNANFAPQWTNIKKVPVFAAKLSPSSSSFVTFSIFHYIASKN